MGGEYLRIFTEGRPGIYRVKKTLAIRGMPCHYVGMETKTQNKVWLVLAERRKFGTSQSIVGVFGSRASAFRVKHATEKRTKQVYRCEIRMMRVRP